jgi:hypothetical protein
MLEVQEQIIRQAVESESELFKRLVSENVELHKRLANIRDRSEGLQDVAAVAKLQAELKLAQETAAYHERATRIVRDEYRVIAERLICYAESLRAEVQRRTGAPVPPPIARKILELHKDAALFAEVCKEEGRE